MKLLYVKFVCVKFVCVKLLYVKFVCLCVFCYEGGGRRRRRSPGYRIKNKNPTQRCGEKSPYQASRAPSKINMLLLRSPVLSAKTPSTQLTGTVQEFTSIATESLSIVIAKESILCHLNLRSTGGFPKKAAIAFQIARAQLQWPPCLRDMKATLHQTHSWPARLVQTCCNSR